MQSPRASDSVALPETAENLRTLSAHDKRRVCVAAICSPGVVEKYLRGGTLRSTSIERVERALRNLSLEHVLAPR